MTMNEDLPIESAPADGVRELCGGVAHALNNLLSVILGETDLALMSGPDNPRWKESLVTIRQAGDQAATLIRHMLAFSERQLPHPSVFDLNELMSAEVERLSLVSNDNIAIVTLASAVDAWVLADRAQIARVIHKLVTNAREAMPSGGKLTVRTTVVTVNEEDMKKRPEVSPGRYVELSVSDTGIGMSVAVRAHIFEALYTTKAQGKATAQSLSTCLDIARQSGGYMEVESTVGVGTICKVALPQVAESAA